MTQPYSALLHDQMDIYRDPFDDTRKVTDQMVWLISKGDRMLSDKPTRAASKFRQRFSSSDPKLFSIDLVVYTRAIEGEYYKQPARYAKIRHGTNLHLATEGEAYLRNRP
jgi:hypothetical protein